METAHEIAFQKFCDGFFSLTPSEKSVARSAWEASLEAEIQIRHEEREKQRMAMYGKGSISRT